MFEKELENRNIPYIPSDKILRNWDKTRQEALHLLCEYEYGFLPPPPQHAAYTLLEEDLRFCAGKTVYQKYNICLTLENGSFSFPVYFVFPKNAKSSPAIVHINFRDAVPDKYMPTEEICDHGFAVVSFCYKDITSDSPDFSDGLAGLIFENGKRSSPDAPGKIALWAWAAIRVMDFLQTLPNVDHKNIAVAGHSRLGKTALLTAACDTRFSFAYSNNSGCCGDALFRGKAAGGETLRDICANDRYFYWFCENLYQYIDNESALPFDQNFLISCIAPRNAYIASAKEDIWADPASQFLCGIAASKTYQALGLKGLVCPSESLPQPGQYFHDGKIGYHIREGLHYFSRQDWLYLMSYLKKHKNE